MLSLPDSKLQSVAVLFSTRRRRRRNASCGLACQLPPLWMEQRCCRRKTKRGHIPDVGGRRGDRSIQRRRVAATFPEIARTDAILMSHQISRLHPRSNRLWAPHRVPGSPRLPAQVGPARHVGGLRPVDARSDGPPHSPLETITIASSSLALPFRFVFPLSGCQPLGHASKLRPPPTDRRFRVDEQGRSMTWLSSQGSTHGGIDLHRRTHAL
jgi:hypothetical protein